MKFCNLLAILELISVVSCHTIGKSLSTTLTSNSDNVLLAVPIEYNDVPINAYKVRTFRIKVAIGLPAQTFQLAFYTFGSEFSVVSNECISDECNYYNDFPKNYTRNKYNPDHSRTANNTHESFDDTFMASYNGTYYTDIVTFGNYRTGYKKFGTFTASKGHLNGHAADGKLYLGGERIEGRYVSPLLEELKKQIDPPRFTVVLNKPPVEGDTNAEAGYVTFGKINNHLCDGSNVNFVKTTSRFRLWEFKIYEYNYGDYVNNLAALAWPVHNNIITYVPSSLYAKILEKTDAHIHRDYKIYVVDCGKIETFPTIKFKIDKEVYELTSREYVYQAYVDGEEICVFTVESSGDGFAAWILGDNFFRKYCVTFDFGQNKLGFSKQIKS